MEKTAYKELTRLGDGTVGLVLVDSESGLPVPPGMEGEYRILDQGNFGEQLKLNQKFPKTPVDNPSFMENTTTGERPDGGIDTKPPVGGPFNYINKPAVLEALSFLPGMKAASLAIDAKNISEINKARSTLGLEPLSKPEVIEALKNDRKGFIGDVEVNGRKYGVSFEAMTPDGRTALRPEEARTRGLMSGSIGNADLSPENPPTPSVNPTTQPAFGAEGARSTGQPFANSPAFGAQGARDDSPLQSNTSSFLTDNDQAALQSLHPAYRDRAADFIDSARAQGIDLMIASSARTPEEQAALYAQGRTAPGNVVTWAKPGDSHHQYGTAFDVVPRDLADTKNWSPQDPRWEQMGELARDKGFVWGGDWQKRDMPHIQAPGARISELRSAGVDGQGFVQVSPETDLSMRGDFVPTPTPRGAAQSIITEAASPMDNRERTLSEMTRVGRAPDPDLMTAISYTIAGELGSNTLQGIARGDPDAIQSARQEIAAITGTVENRANSTRFSQTKDPYSSVLSPSQYQSLMAENLSTTDQNFSEFGDFIEQAVSDFYNGQNPSPVPDATHYTATYTNPNWESYASSTPQVVGEHRFSAVNMKDTDTLEYRSSPSQADSSAGYEPMSGFTADHVGTSREYDDGRSFNMTPSNDYSVSEQDVDRTSGSFSAGSLSGSSTGIGSGLGSVGTSGAQGFVSDEDEAESDYYSNDPDKTGPQ